MGVPAPNPTLEHVAENLWVATRALPLVVGDVGTRMTVVRLASGDLFVHSPVRLDPPTRAALDALGPVRWVVGPCKVHHFFLGEFVEAYPNAVLCGVPGLPEKRRDLSFAHVLDGAAQPPWGDEIPYVLFAGAPILNEAAFLHRATRTLILTDLAFHRRPGDPDGARVFHWLVGARNRFGPHRIVRAGIRDRVAARASLARILAWDFDRVTVAHGAILEHGGRERMRDAFVFLER